MNDRFQRVKAQATHVVTGRAKVRTKLSISPAPFLAASFSLLLHHNSLQVPHHFYFCNINWLQYQFHSILKLTTFWLETALFKTIEKNIINADSWGFNYKREENWKFPELRYFYFIHRKEVFKRMTLWIVQVFFWQFNILGPKEMRKLEILTFSCVSI